MPAGALFQDRRAAGRAVAKALGHFANADDAIVLGMPRGGVVVAREVADRLGAPLDVIVSRKLGLPGMPEVSLGAIAEGRRDIVDDSVRWYIGVPRRVVDRIVARERVELDRRLRLYRPGPFPAVRGRTVILVDDGLATGATLRAAALALRAESPKRLIAAVPVASPLHCDDVRAVVDELIAVATPEPFGMVSHWYEDFAPTTDAEVLGLLRRVAGLALPHADRDVAGERQIEVPLDDTAGRSRLHGDLGLPDDEPRGLVILAHGGGSSRNSYRNRYLAGRLRMSGWSTLRIDLLLEEEQEQDDTNADLRFDVARIGRRLQIATEWAASERISGSHPIILFGASTGAAAALLTAAARSDLVRGVACRGGRVDLAAAVLPRVRAPVLMVVGGADQETLRLTRESAARLHAPHRVIVIPGAGHTFEEPGALGAVGEQVVRWLQRSRVRGLPGHWLRRFSRAAMGW